MEDKKPAEIEGDLFAAGGRFLSLFSTLPFRLPPALCLFWFLCFYILPLCLCCFPPFVSLPFIFPSLPLLALVLSVSRLLSLMV